MVLEIFFAAGCFWGVEKNFESIEGVVDGFPAILVVTMITQHTKLFSKIEGYKAKVFCQFLKILDCLMRKKQKIKTL